MFLYTYLMPSVIHFIMCATCMKTCPSLSNPANTSPCGCSRPITNRNNNHKHIKQIKDRLPKHFPHPFIILKVRTESGTSRSCGETKTIKPKRCAGADKHNRLTEAKQPVGPGGIYYKENKEKGFQRRTEVQFVGSCWTST